LEDFDWLMHFSLTFFAHPNSAKTAEVFVEHWVMLSVLRKRFRFRGNFSIIRTDKTKKRKRKNFRCRFRRTIRTGLKNENDVDYECAYSTGRLQGPRNAERSTDLRWRDE
jgi:hypothetical protein